LGDYAENVSDRARQNIIDQLNQQYRDSVPNKRRQISNRIERTPLLVKLLKQLHPDQCQLCGGTFFWKQGRQKKYSEVHHIRELSVGGTDAAGNCLVLCANCRRKMHHGDVVLQDLEGQLLVTEANHAPASVRKNVFGSSGL
jgi:5-methylcytosine-specific restriction protein A